MSTEAVDGKTAAGQLVTWVVPGASVTAEPTGGEGSWTMPLTVLDAPDAVKIDCYMDFGDVTTTFTPQETTKQRMCEKVARTVETGETIDVLLNGVYDQQAEMTEVVNLMYATVPKGADVWVFRAYGHDSDLAPSETTVVDAFKGSVRRRQKNEPTAPEEDLKFAATITVSDFFEDVTLTAGV